MGDKVFIATGSAASTAWVGDATDVVQLVSASIFLVVMLIKLYKEIKDK